MRQRTNDNRNKEQWLLVLLIAASLVATGDVVWGVVRDHNGQHAWPQPWEWSPALSPGGQPMGYVTGNARLDPAPAQLAETFTSRPFWIVLALVLLGSIVLMADFPEPD